MIYLHLIFAVSVVMIGYELFMMHFEDHKQDRVNFENNFNSSPRKDVIFYLGYDFEANKFDIPKPKVEPKLDIREQGRIWMENARLVNEYYERRRNKNIGSDNDSNYIHGQIEKEELVYVH